jgi:hypothetical protein
MGTWEREKLQEGLVWDWHVEDPNTTNLHQWSYLNLQILPHSLPTWKANSRLSRDTIVETGIKLHCHLVDWKSTGGKNPLQKSIRNFWIIMLFVTAWFGMYTFFYMFVDIFLYILSLVMSFLLPQVDVKFTFFSASHRTVSNIHHILGHKETLNKYKNVEITPCLITV